MARPRGLAREDVLDAAERILAEGGWPALTLSAVAKALGIRTPSLYAHVDGLAGLRRLVGLRGARGLGEALESAVGPEETGKEGGREALRRLASAYRRFAAGTPGLYVAAQRAVRPGEDDELYRALAEAAAPAFRVFAAAGVVDREAVHAVRALRSALHGFVELERLGGFGMPEGVDESFDRMIEGLVRSLLPPTPG